MRSSLAELASDLAALELEHLGEGARRKLSEILLDLFACAAAAARLDPYPDLVRESASEPGESQLWFQNARAEADDAALVNGTVAHHPEMDDGQPRASFHGAVTVVPAALAVAEPAGGSGREVLTAVAAGYGAALACGEPLLAGVEAHRLHPPSLVGGFGAAAAAGRLLRLSPEKLSGAIALAGALAPFGPFESFTRGASVKDLYAGWPALAGVRAARYAASGVVGPEEIFASERDGLGRFLRHEPVAPRPLDVDAALDVYLKPFACCRALHATLTALETLLPLPQEAIERVRVQTYPFAFELSRDADPSTAVGAKASIPFAVATLLLDGRVDPEAYRPERLEDRARRELAAKVVVDRLENGSGRPARVTVALADGSERTAFAEGPRDELDLSGKLRRLAGDRSGEIVEAVRDLESAPDLSRLLEALRPLG